MRKGFTIVELLIVVVVIAILAAITIAAYNGIQQRAADSAVQSTLAQALKKLEVYKVDNGNYPSALSAAGVTLSAGVAPAYSTNSTGTQFCLAGVRGVTAYRVTNTETRPIAGGCIPSEGLAAEWLFNGNANDTSGNGMNGTVSGATLTTGQNGQANGAYTFSGATQYISLSNTTPLNFTTGQFSVSVWVNLATLAANATWYDILSSTAGGDWSFGINATAAGVGRSMMTKVSQIDAPVGPTVEQNIWKHLVVVYTYGPSPSTVAYYLDGSLVATTNWSHAAQGTFTPGTKRIGSRAASGYFRGALDDLRVYSRALSDGEVRSMFAAGAQ